MARKISVEIVGDARSLEKAFAKSSRSAQRFQGDMTKTSKATGSAFKGLGKIAGLAGGAIGIAGLAGAARLAVGEMVEAEKVSAQTAAALKSTGKAARVSAKQVEALADSTLKLTGIDDEATQSAENLLLTFTNVRGEIFKSTVPAIADLATAMNQGSIPSTEQMQQATLQLGKALNDPIRGLGALRRVGIAFTAQQQAQIKALVKAGDTAAAQRVILAELNREMGGRAAAAGRTMSGQYEILRQTVTNLAGQLAKVLAPSVQKLLQQAVKWLNNSKNQKAVLDTVRQAAQAVEVVVKALTGAFKGLNVITGSTRNTLLLLIGAFTAFKALRMVPYIAKLAKVFRSLAAAEAAASTAGALGGVGKLGRLGRVARLGVKGGLPTAAVAALAFPDTLARERPTRGRNPYVGRTIPGMIQVEGGIHLHGVQNVPKLEQELSKRTAGRPHRRRGAR